MFGERCCHPVTGEKHEQRDTNLACNCEGVSDKAIFWVFPKQVVNYHRRYGEGLDNLCFGRSDSVVNGRHYLCSKKGRAQKNRPSETVIAFA